VREEERGEQSRRQQAPWAKVIVHLLIIAKSRKVLF